MQEKGEVDEAELRALEEDVTGKVRVTRISRLRLEMGAQKLMICLFCAFPRWACGCV